MTLKISSAASGDVTLLKFDGNLDTNTSNAALETLNSVLDGGANKLILDFGAVDFVSSAGLRVLLATAKRLNGCGGAMRICGLNEMITEIFEISGFSTILNVFPTEDEARAGF